MACINVNDIKMLFQAQVPTTLAPLVVITAGERRLPIWPEPPRKSAVNLPQFCPLEHRSTIINKFRIHLHQHPEIPFNDTEGTHLMA